MKQSSSSSSKIAAEMFYHQGSWALAYLVIVFLIHLVIGITNSSAGQEGFFSITYSSTKGFMLVIGIISAFGFLSYYVRNGFTRKDFFTGAALAALLLSLAFPVVVGPISMLLRALNGMGEDSTVLQQFGGSWLIALASYGIQIFVFYLVGWMIGSAFYKYNWIYGLGFIAIGIVLIGILDVLWQFELASLWENFLPPVSLDVSLPVSFAGSAGFIILGLTLIRLLTRRVTIKL
ncbi:Tat pathway signal protein [Paenibacillus sp. FSL M8-0334]|uniref:Tat pathway signal protein n=1 Tax=Paenibacillus sp. FSL M8-0334 TaxID=2921623 RepID=UPI0030F883BB